MTPDAIEKVLHEQIGLDFWQGSPTSRLVIELINRGLKREGPPPSRIKGIDARLFTLVASHLTRMRGMGLVYSVTGRPGEDTIWFLEPDVPLDVAS
ncbi:MAG: hypothetical protein AAGA48_26275 [Myxococcota bacterium]